jgi:hypothetical protein
LNISEKVILIYRRESSWIGFDKDEISLSRNENGCFLKGRPIREPVQPYYGENNNDIKLVPISEKWVTSLFKRFERTCIPIYSPSTCRSDGSFMELEIGYPGNEVNLSDGKDGKMDKT